MNKFTSVQIGIIILTVATALIHLSLFPDPVFMLNGLGYLGLLAAYFLPLPFLAGRHKLVWWGFLGYTLLTIFLWIVIGDKSSPFGAVDYSVKAGYAAKAVEVVLVALLWVDRK